jgi:hypothetical protein
MSESATKSPRAIRVVVDLLVDEDIWQEKKAEGCTDKFLVGEIRRTLRIESPGPCYDHEVQQITIVEKGGTHGQE